MSLDRLISIRDRHRTLALAAGLGLVLSGSPGAGAFVTNGADSRDARSPETPVASGRVAAPSPLDTPFGAGPEPVPGDGPRDGLDILGHVLAALSASLDGVLSLGPSVVVGQEACPRSADGHALDCTVAARMVCGRNGFASGLELGTVTRRICRGVTVASFAVGNGADCKPKTFVARALCW